MPLGMDPSPAFSFSVEIDGIEIPKVIEVSGLKSEVGKIDSNHQMNDGKFLAMQVPGRKKPGTFSVMRALSDSKTVTDWLKVVADGDIAGARKTAVVQLRDYQGQPIKKYEFTNCWVMSIELNSLKAGATEQATEKFTVCYDESTVS